MADTVVGAGFVIDTRPLRAEARKWGSLAEKWLMDELTTAFERVGKIAQHEANVLIKGGEGSNLAKASKVTTKVSGIDITTKVSWDAARSESGFPYAAAVDTGRKAFGPVTAKVLRFEIGGEVIFAKWVKKFDGVHFTERGENAAEPKAHDEVERAIDRFVARMDAA